MNSSLEYIKRDPTEVLATPPPLLLLLHGLGSNEQDLFSFAPHLDARYRILSVRAPRTYAYRGFAWFDIDFGQGIPQPHRAQMAESQAQLLSFVEEMRHAYSAARVYLAGFSQGAIMSYSLAMTHPEQISGVLGMSGYVIKDPTLPSVASASLKAIPIFATHGTYDQVLPVFLGRNTRDYFQSLQLNVTYREYPMAHEVSPACFEDCKRWLSTQVADLR